jgi:hypothetical protein
MAKKAQAEFIRWFGPLLDALRDLGDSGRPRELSPRAVFKSCIHEKGSRNHPPSDEAQERNRIKSSVRVLVEHVLGA